MSKMRDLTEGLVSIVVGVALIAFLVLTVKGYWELPTVYTSHTTGACVKIELSDGSTVGCESLKKFDRYENVWVK